MALMPGALVLAVACAVTIYQGERHAYESASQELLGITESVAGQVARALSRGDTEEAGRIAREISYRGGVEEARLLLDAAEAEGWPAEPGVHSAGRAMVAVVEVPRAGGSAALLMVRAQCPRYSQTGGHMVQIVLLALVAFAIMLLLHDRMLRWLTAPLADLLRAERKVSQEKDYSVRVPVRGSGEIDRLVEQFNTMLGEIEARDASLNAARLELEERIAQRTEELRESEQRFRALFEEAPDAVVLGDPGTGIITDANPAAAELTGRPREELIGLCHTELYAPELREKLGRYAVEYVTGDRPSVPYQTRIRRPDGTEVEVEVVAKLVKHHGQTLSQATYRDITQRKEAEAALRRGARMEVAGTLAGGVAHKFNNLMAVVMGNAALLRHDMGPGHSGMEMLDEIENAAEQAGELSAQMVAFASGGVAQPSFVDLRSLLEDIARKDRPAGVEALLSLDMDGRFVYGDRTQLGMVFESLWQNALEAVQERGEVRIGLEYREFGERAAAAYVGLRPGNHACVTFSDDGPGLSEEGLARAFEPFYTTKFEGRGLGLASAYGIVKNHDGYIRISSPASGGTQVEVILPTAAQRREGGLEEQGSGVSGNTCLVVHGDPSVAASVAQKLRQVGMQVIAAENELTAVARATTHTVPPALALLSMSLPSASPLALFGELLTARPGMRVALLTAEDKRPADVDLLLGQGAVFALAESSSTGQLRTALAESGFPVTA